MDEKFIAITLPTSSYNGVSRFWNLLPIKSYAPNRAEYLIVGVEADDHQHVVHWQ